MAKSSLYVIQVTGGREEHARQLVLRLLPDVAEDCYTPAYEAMKKIHGEWRLCRGVLFPGYIFVQFPLLPVSLAATTTRSFP